MISGMEKLDIPLAEIEGLYTEMTQFKLMWNQNNHKFEITAEWHLLRKYFYGHWYYAYGSGHEGAAVLLPGFAIKWQMIAKSGNKTAAHSWPDPYAESCRRCETYQSSDIGW